jgi:hypothetical protein
MPRRRVGTVVALDDDHALFDAVYLVTDSVLAGPDDDREDDADEDAAECQRVLTQEGPDTTDGALHESTVWAFRTRATRSPAVVSGQLRALAIIVEPEVLPSARLDGLVSGEAAAAEGEDEKRSKGALRNPSVPSKLGDGEGQEYEGRGEGAKGPCIHWTSGGFSLTS